MPPIVIPTEEIVRMMIVLLRISGIMLMAPLFSSQSIPIPVRIAATLAFSFVLAPSLPLSALPAGLNLSNCAGLALGELMVGVLLGFAGACVFAGFQFAGQLISFQMGFSLVNVIDPQTQVEVTSFSFLQNYIGLLFFLIINGHHWFLLGVSESFRHVPVSGFAFPAPLFQSILQLSAEILVIGVRIAGPVIAVSLITDIVMGVLGRAAPQIHIMIVGMPLKLLVGFASFSFSLYFLPRYLETIYSSLYRTLLSVARLAH